MPDCASSTTFLRTYHLFSVIWFTLEIFFEAYPLYGWLGVNLLMGVVRFFVRPQSPFLRPGLCFRHRRAQ